MQGIGCCNARKRVRDPPPSIKLKPGGIGIVAKTSYESDMFGCTEVKTAMGPACIQVSATQGIIWWLSVTADSDAELEPFHPPILLSPCLPHGCCCCCHAGSNAGARWGSGAERERAAAGRRADAGPRSFPTQVAPPALHCGAMTLPLLLCRRWTTPTSLASARRCAGDGIRSREREGAGPGPRPRRIYRGVNLYGYYIYIFIYIYIHT